MSSSHYFSWKPVILNTPQIQAFPWDGSYKYIFMEVSDSTQESFRQFPITSLLHLKFIIWADYACTTLYTLSGGLIITFKIHATSLMQWSRATVPVWPIITYSKLLCGLKLTEVSKIFCHLRLYIKAIFAVLKQRKLITSIRESLSMSSLCPIINLFKNYILFGKLKDVITFLIAIRGFRITVRSKLWHHQCSPYLKRIQIKYMPMCMSWYCSFFKYCYLLLLLTHLEFFLLCGVVSVKCCKSKARMTHYNKCTTIQLANQN